MKNKNVNDKELVERLSSVTIANKKMQKQNTVVLNKSYGEQLKLAQEHQIDATQLEIARLVSENVHTTDFEATCLFINKVYNDDYNTTDKTASLLQLVLEYENLINNGYTEGEIRNIRYYDFRTSASYIHN